MKATHVEVGKLYKRYKEFLFVLSIEQAPRDRLDIAYIMCGEYPVEMYKIRLEPYQEIDTHFQEVRREE